VPSFLTIEQKVECLTPAVGEIGPQLRRFLTVTDASLESGLVEARKIIEYVVGLVLLREGIKAERDLLNNIEILGGKEGKFPALRRKTPDGPVPPPVLPAPLYSTLHNLRIYGNLVAHPWDPQTMELKDVRLTSTDLQVALGQIMRLVEWYFQEYARGPHVDPLYDRLPEPVVARHGEAPPDPAPLLGRAGELGRLRQLLLDGPAKLVTVLAPAGMGKTLLAARAALDAVGHWSGERGLLLWLDLKGAPSFGEVTARVLASLRPDALPTDVAIAQLSPGARLGQIVRGLAERPVLLVLDNFESWLDPDTRQPHDPHVAQLLEQCATRAHRGRVVLTSRVAVELPGVPASGVALVTVGPLPPADAAELLLRQGVAGSDRAVADVRQRFSGNPRLLIMLADVLVKRRCRDLDQGLARFPALAARAADGLLTEVWGELTGRAQRLLQALAVLRPPAAVADLAGVLARLGPDDPGDVEDVLWHDLVPRALVVPAEDGSAFAFEHSLIRDYALGRWPDPAVAHRAALQHYQGALAARPAPDSLDPAHLAVVHHALAVNDHALAAETLTSDVVWRPMLRQARGLELLELCRPLVSAAERLAPLPRFRLRRLAAMCHDNLGDYPAALALLEACQREPDEWRQTRDGCGLLILLCGVLRKLQRYDAAEAVGQEAVALAQRQGFLDGEARGLIELASLERNRGRAAESARLAAAGLEAADRTDDLMLRVMGRSARAEPLVRGHNLDEAERLYREALALCQQSGGVRAEARILQSLGEIAGRQARHDDAMRLVNRAIDIFQKIGDRTGEGIARHRRGLMLERMGPEYAAEALAELRRALRLAFDLDHPTEVASILLSLGALFPAPEDAAKAAVCARTAQDLHTRAGHPRWDKGERDLKRLRARLGPLGVDWQQLERTVAAQRATLLEQASSIDRAAWERFLSAADSAAPGAG
jgi:tetratricopeptide (TPR) repeat protein